MNEEMRKLREIIEASVKQLTETKAFCDWFKGVEATNGDIVVINNSFIYRKPLIKTSKNRQYLCLKVENGLVDSKNAFVGGFGDFNSDFKLFSAKSGNLPQLESLDEALEREMRGLGRLVFVLIGELQDDSTEVSVNHGVIKKLIFDPSAANEALLQDAGDGGKSIVVNQLRDQESAWTAIKPEIERQIGDDLSSLETAFGAAFEKLQDEARVKLVIPARTASPSDTSFIRRILKSVSEQCKLYESALQQVESSPSARDAHLREAMRIAYNFSDDAVKVLQLLVSVADLKAVLLWCTIKEHFEVAEAFRNLPWTKSHKKPSLERYREIIAGARNRAFHNLLAFDRTIEANLEGVDVKARRLTLLPPHGRRKTRVAFDYEDREMVELLAELTRAPEVAVPFAFWEKNVAVMRAFENLLARTEDALWALLRAQGDTP